jgi:tetratricopeptide (TPR) repeat protein
MDTLVDNESIAQDLEIEAESLYRRAIVGFKKALGSEHPDTLLSLSNLAKLLNEKRDYEGAEVLYRETLEVRLKVFGKDHPDSLTNLNKLAELLVAKGEKGEAEALYHQVLEGFENKWGADHPYTFSIIKNLGQLLADEGSYEKMGDYYRRIFLAHKEKFRRVQDYWRSSGKDSHFHPDSPVKASSRQNSYKESTQATLGGYIGEGLLMMKWPSFQRRTANLSCTKVQAIELRIIFL